MNEGSSFWYLENVDMKNIFCPGKMSMQEGHLPENTIKKGKYIYLQNDDADKIFFITEGRVKIGTHSDNGKEITKANLTEGEVVGE